MKKFIPYIFLVLLLLLLNALIFLTSYLASKEDPTAEFLYLAFAPICHQLTSRSLCLFVSHADRSYSIDDCFPEGEFSLSKQNKVEYENKTGYKFPVCSRDVAIYFSMLVGLLILPFIWKLESEEWPNKWILVAAAVPVGIDGITQLVGLRESSNLIRIITGVIIGVVLPFYILPIVNVIYSALVEKVEELGRNA